MIGSSIKANAMVIVQLLFLSAVFITDLNSNSVLSVVSAEHQEEAKAFSL